MARKINVVKGKQGFQPIRYGKDQVPSAAISTPGLGSLGAPAEKEGLFSKLVKLVRPVQPIPALEPVELRRKAWRRKAAGTTPVGVRVADPLSTGGVKMPEAWDEFCENRRRDHDSPFATPHPECAAMTAVLADACDDFDSIRIQQNPASLWGDEPEIQVVWEPSEGWTAASARLSELPRDLQRRVANLSEKLDEMIAVEDRTLPQMIREKEHLGERIEQETAWFGPGVLGETQYRTLCDEVTMTRVGLERARQAWRAEAAQVQQAIRAHRAG